MKKIINFPTQVQAPVYRRKNAEPEYVDGIICMVRHCSRNDGEGSCLEAEDRSLLQILPTATGFPTCGGYTPKTDGNKK